jgi:nicotinamidase-related amidase
MTTLPRDKSALLIIDVQNDVVAAAFERDTRVSNMREAINRARKAGIPVIWVQHSDPWLPIDSDGWNIVPELSPLENEVRVRKLYRSSFEETTLESELERLNVGHLIVAGAETNNCIRHTSHSALERGYDLTLLSDAHTTNSFDWDGKPIDASVIVNELNANFHEYQLPGRSATAVAVSDLPW